MNKNLEYDNDNILFIKLRKLIDILCQLNDCGINEYIKFPRICLVGTISSGKSSVLESILGLDFIPRGNGTVTRRPLEIRLCHTNYGESWAFFEEIKGKKFTDFEKVRETIENLTDEVCDKYRKIVDKPIILYIYSKICPDLTFIDLPGMEYYSFDYVPKNFEELETKDISRRYIEDPLTIILCVIAANSDIRTSEGLKLAKEIDTTGSRTLGILTKLDIMDCGTDARKELLNEEVPLKFGYVGVVNRSKNDIINKLPKTESLRKEKEFFKSNPAYKYLPSEYLGNDALINKLTKIYFQLIRENLQRIIKSLNDKIKKTEEELHKMGIQISLDNAGKKTLFWNMIKEYYSLFKDVLQGKFNNKKLTFLDGEGGYKINILYKKLLEEFTGDYKVTAEYTDEKINDAFIIHEGGSMPGFPSIDAFIYLLRPELHKLKEPIDIFFVNIFQYIEFLSKKILEKAFENYPHAINDINTLVTDYLIKKRDKTKFLIDSIVEMEINYIFTNDNEYLNNFSILPKNKNYPSNNNINNNKEDSNKKSQMINETKPQLQMNKTIFIKEIRNRIDAYFKLIVRNLRESIPKIVGNFFIKEIRENIEFQLFNSLYNYSEISDKLIETEIVVGKRKELNDMIKTMKKIQKEIRSDPDLMAIINESNI